jgi:hypothetical protein
MIISGRFVEPERVKPENKLATMNVLSDETTNLTFRANVTAIRHDINCLDELAEAITLRSLG